MAMLKLYNTLTKSVGEFTPASGNLVTVYCCGPTVYDYAHIGNFRTYAMTDMLVRTLGLLGYEVKFAMNITDVGHLVSDSDVGEDKMEKGARREGKTAWDIAKHFTEAFLADSLSLNLLEPDYRPRPTQHIEEQIAMVSTLVEKGYAYVIGDGVYFDTSKIDDYGKLTGQKPDELKAGARVEFNPEKRNVTDFALWKFSPTDVKRDMEWPSPFCPPGKTGACMGFPGWHIECSAMSMKYLGERIDIHTGGADLIPVHHTNEIAQSEAATGKKPFVRFWVHGQFMTVDGEKMSKSKGNIFTVAAIKAKGYNPIALRYLYMTAHYRAYLNFTWDALTAAQNSVEELYSVMRKLRESTDGRGTPEPVDLSEAAQALQRKFLDSVGNDLNMPQALAVVWETVRAGIPAAEKFAVLSGFDKVLGLDLAVSSIAVPQATDIPDNVSELARRREEFRKAKQYAKADEARKSIESMGYRVEDTADGFKLVKS